MKYYVYELAYPDSHKTFYVGKGCGNRIDSHEGLAKKGKNGRFYEIIREMFLRGTNPEKRKVYFTDDEKDAYEEEQRLIRKYGLGNLANQIETSANVIRNIENWKRRLSISNMGHVSWMKGKHHTKESRLKIHYAKLGKRAGMLGKHHSAESRKQMSQSHRGQHWKPEQRAKIIQGIIGNKSRTGMHNSKEMNAKISKSNKGQIPWMKGKHHSEESRHKTSESLHKFYDSKRMET